MQITVDYIYLLCFISYGSGKLFVKLTSINSLVRVILILCARSRSIFGKQSAVNATKDIGQHGLLEWHTYIYIFDT